jgi:hypothetical protein
MDQKTFSLSGNGVEKDTLLAERFRGNAKVRAATCQYGDADILRAAAMDIDVSWSSARPGRSGVAGRRSGEGEGGVPCHRVAKG